MRALSHSHLSLPVYYISNIISSGDIIVPPEKYQGSAASTKEWYDKHMSEGKLELLHLWRYKFMEETGYIDKREDIFQSVADHLRGIGRINPEPSSIGTFQGKLAVDGRADKDSTNDCAVISPVVIADHIRPLGGNDAITNAQIKDIMDGNAKDRSAPLISRDVRISSSMDPDDKGHLPLYAVINHLISTEILSETDKIAMVSGDVFSVRLKKLLGALNEGEGNTGVCE
jgi:hypothetical protein